jgi:4-amino-4-deoxy-L-arabinose transferase-like glycosyltransferase
MFQIVPTNRRYIDKVVVFILEPFLLMIHYLVPTDILVLRIILGLTSYFFIPGFMILTCFKNRFLHEEILGFGFLFGFSFQLLVMSIFWAFCIEPVDFKLFIPIVTFIFVSIMLAKAPGKIQVTFNQRRELGIYLILLLATSVRLFYFFTNVSSLAIDGGLYLDFARTIITRGKFSSNIINDLSSDSLYNIKGLSSYFLTIASISLFFLIGDVSYTSAKLTVLFIGVMTVYLIYNIAKELFGKKGALIAGFVSSLLPILSYYSSILHGPEILAALFTLTAIYYLILAIKGDYSLSYMFLAGIFSIMGYGAWGVQAFLLLLVCLNIVLLFLESRNRKIFPLFAFLSLIIFYMVRFASLLIVHIPLTIILVIALLFTYKNYKDTRKCAVCLYFLIVILLYQLFLLRRQLIPNAYISTSARIIIEQPWSVINPSTFTKVDMFDFTYLWETLNKFWRSFIDVLTPFLFFSGLFSLIGLSQLRSKLSLCVLVIAISILYTCTLPKQDVLYSPTFPDRFLVLSVCFWVILSGSVATMFESARELNLVIKCYNKILSIKSSMRNISVELILALAIISVFPMHSVYLTKFKEGYTDVVEWYGAPTIDWLRTNTSTNAVILTGEPRRLAWITGKVFVGEKTQSGIFSLPEMLNLIQGYNVTHIIIDTFLITYRKHDTFIEQTLYSSPISLGSRVPLFNFSKILTEFIDSKTSIKNKNFTTYSLKLVFEYSKDSRKVRIYEVSKSNFSIKLEDVQAICWSAGNYGEFAVMSDGFRLMIGENKDYTFTYNKLPLNITLKEDYVKFFVIKIREVNNAKIARVELWYDGKKEVLLGIDYSVIPCIWFRYFTTSKVDDVRIVVEGKPGGYVTFDYVAVGTLEPY